MSELVDPSDLPTLLAVASKSAMLVANITKYLSALPHPIQDVEELVSVCSVTSNLLTSLHHCCHRFYPSRTAASDSQLPFIKPLCSDITASLALFATKISDARRLRVFEPNDVGFVRVPRNAWLFVMGTEQAMVKLRGELYVEKFRVRVLIETVNWQGLRELTVRSKAQSTELHALDRMLPMLAERLFGVWKDYKSRFKCQDAQQSSLAPAAGDQPGAPVPVVEEEKCTVTRNQHLAPAAPVEVKFVEVGERKRAPVAVVEKFPDLKKKEAKLASGKLSIHSSASTDSIASTCSSCSTSSSVTAIEDSRHELWVLRRSEGTRTLSSYSSLLGVRVKKTYTQKPTYHYVKPLASHPAEVQTLFVESRYAQRMSVRDQILQLDEDAQWEIQKLVESRDAASSNDTVKREWNVISFIPRPRRKIFAPEERTKWKFWNRGGNKPLLEWVVILKGDTLDHKVRTTPIKDQDPWCPKPVPVVQQPLPGRSQNLIPGQVRMPIPQSQGVANAMVPPRMGPGAHVLRHVEQRRGLSLQEAQDKMVEMAEDLMGVGRGAKKIIIKAECREGRVGE